jgi:hypothetical protein
VEQRYEPGPPMTRTALTAMVPGRSRMTSSSQRLYGSRTTTIEMKPRRPPGPPMTLGNMRELGVQHPIAYCLNKACRHQELIDVSTRDHQTREGHRSRSNTLILLPLWGAQPT